MLILSRRVGERILVGDGIEIVLSEVGRGRARIGISAPPDVRIIRAELSERIKENSSLALRSAHELGALPGENLAESDAVFLETASAAAVPTTGERPLSRFVAAGGPAVNQV